jgi:dolichyl-phosphate-mannose--protein O-mannosyl transferase
MKNYLKKSSFIILDAILLSFPSFALAQTSTSPGLSDRVNAQAENMQNTAGLGDVSLGVVISMVIRAALTLLGIIFLVIIVFAGYRWMTASGNEEAIQKAQSSIKRAIIGLVIVMLAYAITAFVFNQLPFGAVGGSSGAMTSG